MSNKVETRRISVNGVQLGVQQWGTAWHPGQTLVLLHGFTGNAASWLDLFGEKEMPGWRIIAIDMPGHGQSDAPADPARYSLEDCRADILALMEQLMVRSDEAVLLGYSMGGRIALATALSGFFRALILESASPGLATSAERVQRQHSDEQLAERIEREGIAAFIEYWERLPLFASQSNLSEEKRARLHEQRLNNQAPGLANSLRGAGTGAQPEFYSQLDQLRLPTLVLAGEFDSKFCQIAQHMEKRLPQAYVRIVAQAGHAIHLEQPDTFIAEVCAFCSLHQAHLLKEK